MRPTTRWYLPAMSDIQSLVGDLHQPTSRARGRPSPRPSASRHRERSRRTTTGTASEGVADRDHRQAPEETTEAVLPGAGLQESGGAGLRDGVREAQGRREDEDQEVSRGPKSQEARRQAGEEGGDTGEEREAADQEGTACIDRRTDSRLGLARHSDGGACAKNPLVCARTTLSQKAFPRGRGGARCRVLRGGRSAPPGPSVHGRRSCSRWPHRLSPCVGDDRYR